MKCIFKLSNLVFLTLLLSFVFLGYAKSVSARVVFSDSFNRGNITGRYNKHGGCYSHNFRQRSGLLRVTNNMWQDNRNCSSWAGRRKTYRGRRYYTRRAELLPKSRSVRPTYGREFEWTFDLRFVRIPSRTPAVIFQVISEPWRGVDIALRVDRGNLWIHVRGRSRRLGRVRRGRWNTITIQFKRSVRSDGYVQLFIDHDLRFRHRGQTTQSRSNNTMAKFGVYNGNDHNGRDRSQFIVEFDDLRIERF